MTTVDAGATRAASLVSSPTIASSNQQQDRSRRTNIQVLSVCLIYISTRPELNYLLVIKQIIKFQVIVTTFVRPCTLVEGDGKLAFFRIFDSAIVF